MAARRETSQRKAALLHDLREEYRGGHFAPGAAAPSVRELARKYELSLGSVGQQLQILVREGVFHTVAGAGTFVGRPSLDAARFFLFVPEGARREPLLRDQQMQMGFEDEIVRRGGAALVMTRAQIQRQIEARGQLETRALPPLDGVFVYRAEPEPDAVWLQALGSRRPLFRVNSGDFSDVDAAADLVSFDHFDGGLQAAQHLLGNGHERVAYLGLHAPGDARDVSWSVERLRGWQAALGRADVESEGLLFLPRTLAARWVPQSARLLKAAAHRLLREARASAVVAANDDVAAHLIEALREMRVDSQQWPSIVSFDDSLPADNYLLTSLRLPWQELGRAAAALLWERAHGQLSGAPIRRQIPLRIIPRLTCRPNWSAHEPLAATPQLEAVG